MRILPGLISLGALLVAGCATTRGPAPGVTRSPLINGQGAQIGYVDSWEDKGFSYIDLKLRKGFIPGGNHGMHFHEVGRCDPPGFTTAGGHWNPTGKQHGQLNPRGYHVGDWGNMIVFTDKDSGAGLVNPIPHSFADADGTSLVIHASPDDLTTDPSGNSGARIACAVLTRPK